MPKACNKLRCFLCTKTGRKRVRCPNLAYLPNLQAGSARDKFGVLISGFRYTFLASYKDQTLKVWLKTSENSNSLMFLFQNMR